HFNLIFNLVQTLIDAVGHGIGSRFTRGYILIFHQKSVVTGAVKGFVVPEFGNGRVSGVCYLNGFKFLTSVHDWTGTYHPGYFKIIPIFLGRKYFDILNENIVAKTVDSNKGNSDVSISRIFAQIYQFGPKLR